MLWSSSRIGQKNPAIGTSPSIKANIDIFDFELSGADVEAITLLNRSERTGPDPDKFDRT